MYAFLSNFTVIPFDNEDAACFGNLRAALAQAGTPIGAYDVMIAAQGLTKGLTVVTHNTGEFPRVPGLKLEDWAV
jgi:tRNA(fMet)-specific endonuclease VapC